MHHTVENIPSVDDDCLKSQQNLDILSHGKVPKWLEDMSKNIEIKYSVKNDESFDRLLNDTMNLSKTSSSTPARYGRRASVHSQTSTMSTFENMNNYIVPKYEVNFGELSKFKNCNKPVQRYTSRFLKKYESRRSNDEDEFQSYSPSILEQERGKSSRIDAAGNSLNNTLISTLKLPTVTSLQDIKHFKSKSVPDESFYLTSFSIPKLENSMKTLNVNQDSSSSISIEKFNTLKTKDTLSSLLDENDLDKYFSLDYERMVNQNDLSITKSQTNITLPTNKTRFKKLKFRQENHLAKESRIQSDAARIDNHVTGDANDIENVFIIPELPVGKNISIDILTTWGDRDHVGLNGIEFFASDGCSVPVEQISFQSNILTDLNADRSLKNIIDGVNRTQDDLHVWLASFCPGEHHIINIKFKDTMEIAMIRIWNYNKSRIHSYQGVKDIMITLDHILIFKGEIAQSCGSILGSLDLFGDTILFTTNEEILVKISQNDSEYATITSVPVTETFGKIERPLTASADAENNYEIDSPSFMDKSKFYDDQILGAQIINIVFVQNWEHPSLIGLTGIEIIGASNKTIVLKKENLCCNGNSMVDLGRLIDGENITTDADHMWYAEYIPKQEIELKIYFHEITYVTGIRLWNFNENLEMSFAGVCLVKIYLDNKLLANVNSENYMFLLRRAPGNANYDFVQEIKFFDTLTSNIYQGKCYYDFSKIQNSMHLLFEQPNMPEGFVFQIVIYTTWGDQYYVGLNGIELYDQHGRKIYLYENNICAHPESINVLPGISGDIRTPDKLINGINDRNDGTHSWLAPIIPKCLNRIYIVFDQPITVSVIKLWNYYKTPLRGVKEFGILIDDLLVYNGILDKANVKSPIKYRTVLFTDNKDVIQKEMASLVKHTIDSQATVLMNNDLRMTTGGSLPNVDQSLRPFTSVNHFNHGRSSSSN